MKIGFEYSKTFSWSGHLPLWLRLLLVAFGMLAFWFAVKHVIKRRRILVSWIRTTGRIIDARVTTSRSEGETMYSAEYNVLYLVADQEYTLISKASYSSSDYVAWSQKVASAPGKSQDLFYNPADPCQAYASTDMHVRLLPALLLAGVGAAPLTVAVLMH